jgi:enoyl-[acyl-carrier-protein] reductase (NADH)
VTDLNRESLERGPVREYIDKRIPGKRPGTADEIAKLVAAIYSENIPFFTGETIYIDGGQGMAH